MADAPRGDRGGERGGDRGGFGSRGGDRGRGRGRGRGRRGGKSEVRIPCVGHHIRHVADNWHRRRSGSQSPSSAVS
jgi:hypothetical protein